MQSLRPLQPETDIRTQQKRVQLVLSIVLVFIVVGLIGGYIYLGMRMAKQNNGIVASSTASSTAESENREPTPEEQRALTVQALRQNAKTMTSTDTDEQALAVSGLKKDRTQPPTDEEKQQIIQALQRP